MKQRRIYVNIIREQHTYYMNSNKLVSRRINISGFQNRLLTDKLKRHTERSPLTNSLRFLQCLDINNRFSVLFAAFDDVFLEAFIKREQSMRIVTLTDCT